MERIQSYSFVELSISWIVINEGVARGCAWPTSITTTKCDECISLACVIHGCHHGPSIVVGGHRFTPEDNLNITCVRSPDSTGFDGTWVAYLTLNISDVV